MKVSMKINQKQIDAVLALDGQKRFEHFVKVVADWQEVWGLYSEGWALASDDEGRQVFPVWPAREYAQTNAIAEWSGYEPRAMPLDEFMEVLLPKFREDGVLPGVFFTPESRGVTPTVDDLLAALKTELRNYD